jgi:hypothetical protein
MGQNQARQRRSTAPTIDAASINGRPSTRSKTRQGWTPSAKDEEPRVHGTRSRSLETHDRVKCDDSTAAVCKSHRRCFMRGMAPSLVSSPRRGHFSGKDTTITRGVIERTRSRSLETHLRAKGLDATSAVYNCLSSRGRGRSTKSNMAPCLSSPDRRPSEEAKSPPPREVERTRSTLLEPSIPVKSDDSTVAVSNCLSSKGCNQVLPFTMSIQATMTKALYDHFTVKNEEEEEEEEDDSSSISEDGGLYLQHVQYCNDLDASLDAYLFLVAEEEAC